ncbi:MAG: glycerophosphoryl diester phosphodiesterase membrane domain-containing protein [Novosphingobium sp.]
MTSPIKLDTNRAWQSAHAAILSNREAFLALAGVFFLLPTLAFALFNPQPPAATAPMSPEQAAAFFEKFYRDALPFMLLTIVAQTIGAMAIFRLLTHSNRPTVGDALGKGLVDTVAFFAAALMVGLAEMVAAVLIIGLGVATGIKPVAGIAAAVAVGALLYISVRVVLVMPAIAVEGIRNPAKALRRSWELTRGNAGRIVLFLLLLGLAAAVINAVVALVLGLVLALALGAKGAAIAVAVVSSAISAAFTLYLYTALASIHRQLAGPTAAELGTTFD